MIADPTAKRFIKVMARSDLATESHNTNGLNALKNYVMDIEGYIGLYSIQNGNEQLIHSLQSEIDADIQLNHRVLKVGKADSGRYAINMMNGKGPVTKEHDLVVMCLPHSWLATMRWDGELLRHSMVKHIAYFDRPAHYLRVSILFDEPFWGDKIPGAWWMSEAFGGCCVLCRRRTARRRPARRAELADPRIGCAGLRQSQRQGTDRRGDQVAAEIVRRFALTFSGRQDPSLAVVGERHSGRLACARRDDQPSSRAIRTSGLRCGRRLSVRLDVEWPAGLLRRRHRHHSHADDQAAL